MAQGEDYRKQAPTAGMRSSDIALPAGQQLKTLRHKRNITLRGVEQASRRIAGLKGDKRYCVSNGWLTQLENGASEPNIQKFFSLSVIYRVNLLELLRLYDVDVDETQKYERVADPYLTQLTVHKADVSCEVTEQLETILIADEKVADETHEGANSNHAPHIVYGHLGLTDFTMYPMIRPGALLKIDTSQNKLSTDKWRDEYERPIFFIELRNAYACGWCQLDGNQLLLIPHPSGPAKVRAFKYPREAEIVGRVVAYETACVEVEAKTGESSQR